MLPGFWSNTASAIRLLRRNTVVPSPSKPTLFMRRLQDVIGRRLALMAGLLAMAAFPAWAQTPSASKTVSFSHKDWALQCDNTRTCRAVGYQSESGDSDPVSMLLTRKAGPDEPVEVQLQVYAEKADPSRLQLRVGKFTLPALEGSSPKVPAAQVPRLIQELIKAEDAMVSAGKDLWTLSLAGANAVLLKMDEAQGRIGTAGALVRKGSKPESSVLPALPAPVIKGVKPVAARKGDAALVKPVLAAVGRDELEGQCTGGIPEASEMKLHRLTERKVLLEIPCAMGAYNFGSLLFIANDRPPYQPELQGDVDGEFDPAKGTVQSSMKGRGIGDCWWVREWVFDGKGFVLTGERGDSMCRGFPGGAWQLPVLVTQPQ